MFDQVLYINSLIVYLSWSISQNDCVVCTLFLSHAEVLNKLKEKKPWVIISKPFKKMHLIAPRFAFLQKSHPRWLVKQYEKRRCGGECKTVVRVLQGNVVQRPLPSHPSSLPSKTYSNNKQVTFAPVEFTWVVRGSGEEEEEVVEREEEDNCARVRPNWRITTYDTSAAMDGQTFSRRRV